MTNNRLLVADDGARMANGGRREWIWAGLWMLLGLALRVWQFDWYPLREDEALYGYWARLIASERDVMLEWVAVDKPPFFIYALARWFQWFGPSDASGRSLNVLLSILTMVVLWRLARRIDGPRVGLAALAFFALSPFAISFAPTLYTDPMLTLWIALALWAASWRLGLLAGLALGMGFATKQNALLFVPLIMPALLLGRYPRRMRHWRSVISDGYRCLRPRSKLMTDDGSLVTLISPLITFPLGFSYIAYKVWQWDRWRILPAHIPDFWTQAWRSYGGLRFIPPADWSARAVAWWEVGRWWGGWVGGTAVLIGLSLVAVLAALRGRTVSCNQRTRKRDDLMTDDWSLVASSWTLLFAGFILFYLALHLAVSFQTWDRYLLPLTPLAAMLSARGALILWDAVRGWSAGWRWGLAAALALILALGAARAATARIPVGGDHGAYTGLLSVAHYLKRNVPPYHGVIYQRWLGWQWDWYLWDREDRVYWADEAMLVDDLASDPYGYARFVVFPAWELDKKPALEAALAPLGLHLEERLRVKDGSSEALRFVVYEIEPHIRLGK
ncbi:MAG TPA: hypothetical protein G4O05_01460 [Caldilineae bacterium]|nr:hypothetical protein [Caldilineae bacterium]